MYFNIGKIGFAILYVDTQINGFYLYIYIHIHIRRLFIKRGKKETFHMEMKPSSDSIF